MSDWSPRSKFFEDLLGVQESAFRASDELVRKAWTAPRTITNLSTGKNWDCGEVSLPTLAELRVLKVERRGSKPGKLTVLKGDKDLRQVDVGHLQSLPQNRHALFQVASNFNGLELMNKFDDLAMHEVSNYIHDRTQGPFASISAAPGLILRHYYPFYSPDSPPGTWRQKYDGKQLEFLGNTSLSMKNGYVQLTPESLQEPLDDSVVKILHHRDIQVSYGAVKGSQHALVSDESQRIDQVFTATADLACTNRELLDKHPEAVERLVRRLLDSSYEGALRAATSAGRGKVYLTLIGGGVFANPPSWIVGAIEKQLPLIVESGMEVVLNTYRGIPSPEVFDRVIKLAEKTGGGLIVR